ncbi:hypothetical protein QG083_03320 [Kingella kingae]|uniref:hypothetical protein n=1 Tax=Kingella kingae TaxID=504 RepID=UPI00254BD0AE|nr:hypothetical protein [Kingella kingae]MDK4612216.1 hypothetical protein [Kingella kingae]
MSIGIALFGGLTLPIKGLLAIFWHLNAQLIHFVNLKLSSCIARFGFGKRLFKVDLF